MAKKEAQIEEDIIDLTELIESGDKGDKRAASAYAKAAALAGDDSEDEDFSAILAETTAAQAPRKVDPDEALDMGDMGGIDTLLESLDIPPQPREAAAKAAPAQDTDLDSVLDDLLGGAPEAKTAPAAAPKPAAPDPADELDALLSGAEPAPKPAQPKAASDADADLDDLLASFDEPEPAAKAAAEAEGDIAADLDDILGDIAPPEPPAAPKTAPKEAPAAADKEPSPQPAPMPEPAPGPELDAGLGGIDELDNLLNEEPAPKSAPEEAETGSRPEPEPQAEDGALDAELEPARAPQALEQDAGAGQQPMQPPAAAQAELAAAPPALTHEALLGLCRNFAAGADAAALQGFSRELGEQSAHVEDMGAQVEHLGKRLLACETKLAAARARISGLEKAVEATAALDDLLRAGTPLHNGFMALISAAVANALKGFPAAPQPDAALLEHIGSLSARMAQADQRIAAIESNVAALSQAESQEDVSADIGRLLSGLESADAKIAALEKRVAELSASFDAKVEHAAAAAASKVLREEIARLAQE